MKKHFLTMSVCLCIMLTALLPATAFAEESTVSKSIAYEGNAAVAYSTQDETLASDSNAMISPAETYCIPYWEEDLSIWKWDRGNVFSGITTDSGYSLINGTDYTITKGEPGNDDEVLLKNSYMKSLLGQTVIFTFMYETGTNPSVTVHVEEPLFRILKVIDGTGSVWQQGDKNFLSFTTEESPFSCVGIMVDGKVLSTADFAISQENRSITMLMPAYLSTLSTGDHTIRILFGEGSLEMSAKASQTHYFAYSETTFTIKEAAPAKKETSSRTDSDPYFTPVVPTSTAAPEIIVAPTKIDSQVTLPVVPAPDVPAPLPRTGGIDQPSGLWLILSGLFLSGLTLILTARWKKAQ